jgi:hypothetical protein
MRDYRDRTIKFKDRKRIKHLPKKRIEDCFIITIVNFETIQNIPIETNIFNEWNKQYVINQQKGN